MEKASGNHLDGKDRFHKQVGMQELYGDTKKIPVGGKWILSGNSWLILPVSGSWMRRLHSLRSQKVILLHIRPIVASPMKASLALLRRYEGINARDEEELLQRKASGLLIPKGER